MGGPPGSPQILRTNGNQKITLANSPVQAPAAPARSVLDRSPVQGKTPADLRRATKKQYAGPPVPLDASWAVVGSAVAASPPAAPHPQVVLKPEPWTLNPQPGTLNPEP